MVMKVNILNMSRAFNVTREVKDFYYFWNKVTHVGHSKELIKK